MVKRRKLECKSCGQERYIYARGLCGICYTKDRQAVYRERNKERINRKEILDAASLQKFYKSYWNANLNRICYECGCPIHTFRSWHIMHIIPKRLWKKYLPIDIVFNPENIRYGCLSCHSNFDNGGDSPKLNNLKNQLEEKWKHLN